jgi:hypothetical protein
MLGDCGTPLDLIPTPTTDIGSSSGGALLRSFDVCCRGVTCCDEGRDDVGVPT